jgi:hypothetical protein
MKVTTTYPSNKDVIIDTASLLPFVPEPLKLTRENSITYKLRVTPSDKDSPIYEKSILVLSGNEPVREVLQWFSSLLEIIPGLNASTVAEVDTIVRRTIKNTALTAYELKHQELLNKAKEQAKIAAENHNSTTGGGTVAAPLTLGHADYQDPEEAAKAVTQLTNVAQIIECYRAVVTYMCPKKLVARVKRTLRRSYRKKPDMTTREWINHFRRINDVEIPLMPPNFTCDNSLKEDEILDCLLYSVPKSWAAKMEEQGFDPYIKPLSEVVDFCERIEVSEGILNKPNSKGKASINDEEIKKPSSNNKKGKNPSKKSASKYCAYHGGNNTHDTKDCKVLKALREQKKEKDEKSGSKNKSWNRKAEEAKKKSEKELNALIDKAVKTKVQESLAAISKKRRSDDENSDDELNKLDFSKLDFDTMSKNDDDSFVSCVSVNGETSD